MDDVEALNLSETSQVESLSELLLELLSEQSRPALRSNLRILAIRKHECFSREVDGHLEALPHKILQVMVRHQRAELYREHLPRPAVPCLTAQAR